eukprot:g3927.t1
MSGDLVCSYAALILHDAGKKVTEENINKVVEAAKCKTEPYWPMLFANLLKNKDIEEVIFKPSGGGGGAAAAGGAAGEAGAEAEEEEKEEEEEEEEAEVGGLFGGDAGDDAAW